MVKIKNLNELAKRIAWEMEQHGPSCSLNHLDVSAVDDMGVLFYESPFDGDISNWNVSNVRNMSHMFAKSAFNWRYFMLECLERHRYVSYVFG